MHLLLVASCYWLLEEFSHLLSFCDLLPLPHFDQRVTDPGRRPAATEDSRLEKRCALNMCMVDGNGNGGFERLKNVWPPC